jgi:hypothetical protein
MIPTPSAVRKLVKSPAVQAAPRVVRSWLVTLLLRGEKGRGAGEPGIGREKAPVRNGNPGR